MNPVNNSVIFDSNNSKDISGWEVVNDGVMGGLSQGSFTLNNSGNAVYSGTVSTENNGGFSSVRYGFDTKIISEYTVVKLKIKGDGKSYQFRVKANASERYWYITSFKTSGTWETMTLPLEVFHPSFRGNKLEMPNFNADKLEEVAILIANNTNEKFSLEIEKIHLE